MEGRLLSDEKGRWKNVLLSKYDIDLSQIRTNVKCHSWWWRDLCQIRTNAKCHSWRWRDLSKSCGEGDDVGWFQGALGWKVGEGDKIRFWEDTWAARSPLSSLYPRLFSLTLDQWLTVVEVGVWEYVMWFWRLRLRRDRFQWESTHEEDLIRLISRVKLCREVRILRCG